MHKFSHCLVSGLTCLVLGDLKQNAQAFHNCSSPSSLWSDDRACHNSENSNSLEQYDWLSHDYNTLRNHYSHLNVVSSTYYIMVIAQNSVELVSLPQAALVYPDFLAHSFSYLLSEASHRVRQACFGYWASLTGIQTFHHYVDLLPSEVDLVVILLSMHCQYSNSDSYQPSPMIPVVSHT